jgi:hypothetical protein
MTYPVSWAALAAAFAAAPAFGRQAPDKSAYDLCHPTPRALLRDLSTDRPDTTESPYTVDAGHFQVELSFVDYTRDRAGGQTRTTLAVAPMLLKAGLLHNVDLQLGLDPWTHERTGGEGSVEGFGDTIVRLKVNLWGNDAGDTAFALMPFVKLPTADDDLGNGRVEGGLIAPLAVALPAEFALGLMAELDLVADDDGGYTPDFVHTGTLGRAIVGDLAGYVEYAGFADLAGDQKYRAYFDAGLTYAVGPDAQLDAGVRVGLTEAADDLGLFAGLSVRY